MKVVLIVPYFGALPNYFQIFLDSCKENPKFDWIVFTDDETEYDYPPNVHRIQMSFSACREMIQSSFDFEVTLTRPQKLCDYKCAYGYIFREYLTGYDWWGHCDLDQIFGNLSNFITEEMLGSYDKIGSLGHLSLYRNTPENNRIFMTTNRYCEVFSTERGCGFDEWIPGNINEIFLHSNQSVMLENYGADVNAYCTTFELVHYNVEMRQYEFDNIRNNIFSWQDGKIFRFWKANGHINIQEYPYVHLQKRRMRDHRCDVNSTQFYIIPNEFTDFTTDIVQLLRRSQRHGIINSQWFCVKWNALKYRVKNNDWEFINVFSKR